MSRRKQRRAQLARGAAVLNDGLESMAMKMGQRQQGMIYARHQYLTQNKAQLTAMWIEDWISRKICDRKARDMTRRWREVRANSLTAKQLDQYQQLERTLNVRDLFRQAAQWASLYGTSALLMITEAQDMSLQLADNEKVKRLLVADRHSISSDGVKEFDVLSPDFGLSEFYRIKGSQKIHRSRIILIHAGELPLSDPMREWGTSDLEHVYAAIKRFDLISLNIGELVNESKIDIFKMEGYSNKISGGLEDQVMAVMAATQRIKSISNSLLLDKDAEYEQKELTFTGLRDLMVEFRNAVAGAADMPVTILFGQSASGFASGKEDIQTHHENIHGLQESRLRPAIDRLDQVLCRQLFGQRPEDWWYEFPSLTEMTEQDKGVALFAFAQAAALLIQNGVLREDQVASELKQSTFFDNVSDDDVKALKAMVTEALNKDPYGFSPITAPTGQADPAQSQAAANDPIEANRGVVPASAG
ncbi:MAG: DUF1073 domain-containing protein [Burkholderiaceae bacterium]|nr:DUF1073 domain-containing protein [Burkholderiaceae bacterium]